MNIVGPVSSQQIQPPRHLPANPSSDSHLLRWLVSDYRWTPEGKKNHLVRESSSQLGLNFLNVRKKPKRLHRVPRPQPVAPQVRTTKMFRDKTLHLYYRCQREGVLREFLRNQHSSGRFIPGIIFRSDFFGE